MIKAGLFRQTDCFFYKAVIQSTTSNTPFALSAVIGAKRGEGPQSALRADMLRSPIPVALTDSMYIVGLWFIRPTASGARDQEPGRCGFV